MITKYTYYIKRCNIYIWLAQDIDTLPTDELIEIRTMLFADDGKILVKDGEEVGQAIWIKDYDSQENYIEQDIPIIEKESEYVND